MNNNHLNAQLKRDADTAAGLLADQPHYQPLEDDIKPLRTEHAANLTQAQQLAAEVLADDADDAAQAKTSARKQLKPLAARLAATLQAYAASATNQDPDLAGRVRLGTDGLGRADDASFATLVAALLHEAQPLATQLAKREFAAADLASVEALLARFGRKRTQQRLTLVAGSTARKTLIALLKRNTDLIKMLRVQLKPYQNAPAKHDVWLRFQGYTKLIEYGGGGPKGAASNAEAPAA